MNRVDLLAMYRSLTRHKRHAALNIGGLAVGIAVFLVLGLFVRFETSFEAWLPRHDRVYVVQTVWSIPEGGATNGAYSTTMGGLLDQLVQDFPTVIGTRIRGGEDGGTVLRGGIAISEDVAQVDPSFLDVFALPLRSGDARSALRSPMNALISESTARKYFGNDDPLGQTLTVAMDEAHPYRIAGVFRDLPNNSEYKLSILIPLPRIVPDESWNRWGSTTLQTFLRFDTPQAARVFEQKLPSFVDRRGFNDLGPNASRIQQLSLLPLTRQHLEPQGQQSASRKLMIVTLGTVGLLTLLIAVVNYVNLATAHAGLRAREVAMRKVLGADRGALIRQFLGEAILTVAVAALIGLALTQLSLPIVNAAGGLSLTIPYVWAVPGLALLSLVVGVAAGLYPAIMLSSFPAAAVLASARSPGGGRSGTRIRETLVVVQFGLAIALIAGTLVLFAQTWHVRQTDLGFRRSGLLVVRSFRDSLIQPAQRRAIADAIRALPGVQEVTLSNSAVGGSGANNSDNVALPGVPGDGPSLSWAIVGPRFFQTYGARLLAGRVFDDAHGDDAAGKEQTKAATNIVINRSALAALRFRTPEDAIGRTIGGSRPRTVIGVIDDLRFSSPRDAVNATYYVYYRDPEHANNTVASVRFSGAPSATLSAVRAIWQRLVSDVAFDGDTADKRLDAFYEADDRAARLFAIGSALAVAIACVGLWGLASFNTQRRIKEIGIRKTLGASSANVVRLLILQFLRPVVLANLVAWPLAFVAMRLWLAGFDDRIVLSPFYFLGASLLATVIAALTVADRSLRAARATPAWALRHE